MSERVTWLLPVKNGMPYLPETLASIEAQTYRDFEMLAWDNGSTDGTLEELQRWIPSRLPGRLVSDRPLGLGACLREMVLQAETELCARIDADDVNHPQRLEKQVAFLREHPEIAAVGSQINVIDAGGVNHGQQWKHPQSQEDIVHAFLSDNPISHPAILMRRSAVLEAGNYRDVGPINIEDYDLWLRILPDFQFANLGEMLIDFRIHERSTTYLAASQNRLKEATDRRFCEHAPRLFGCTESEARLLREAKHPRAITVLAKMARHLEKTQPGQTDSRLRSESFQKYSRPLIANSDLISLLSLRARSRNKLAVPRELWRVVKSVAKRIRSKKTDFRSADRLVLPKESSGEGQTR